MTAGSKFKIYSIIPLLKQLQLRSIVIGIYYIHFEITGDPCNLIRPQQCDLFTNRTILGSKSHLFFSANENKHKKKTTNQIESNMFFPLLHLTEILTDDFNIEM